MLEFISKDVREYMEQNGLVFSDFEKAAIIHNSHLPVMERMERLKRLAEETEDEALREQILANLAWDQEEMDAFRDRSEGCVYSVEVWDEDGEEDIRGYFAEAHLAYDHGRKQDCGFRIAKHLIVGYRGQQPKKSKGCLNPYLMEDAAIEDCVVEHESFTGSVAEASYDKDGRLTSFWSTEVQRSDEERLKRSYDPESYENAFIPLPNPFELGDIVRAMGSGEHGVVTTSQREWQEFLEQVEEGRLRPVEFMDANLIVDCLLDNGFIRHGHICPIFLERYEPEKGEDDYGLLLAGQGVLRGQCGLEWFTICYDGYKKRKRKEKPDRGVITYPKEDEEGGGL